MLLTAKFIVIKLHLQFNWIGTKAKMFQQHEIFRFCEILKNQYSGLTAGCNLKLATYVDIPILKIWSKLHYPAPNQTQVIRPQKMEKSLKSQNLHIWNGDNCGLPESILVKLLFIHTYILVLFAVTMALTSRACGESSKNYKSWSDREFTDQFSCDLKCCNGQNMLLKPHYIDNFMLEGTFPAH